MEMQEAYTNADMLRLHERIRQLTVERDQARSDKEQLREALEQIRDVAPGAHTYIANRVLERVK